LGPHNTEEKEAAMKKLMVLAFAATIALCGVARAEEEQSSEQQMLCNKRAAVMEHLSQQYSEAPSALGMSANGGVIEVLTSKDGATFTILMTTPEGLSCLVAMGSNWEDIQQVAAGPKI
jgi:hypothetical protein